MCDSCRKYNLDHSTISQDLDYILNQPASEQLFWNGIRDEGRTGMRLNDFANSAVMQSLLALDPSGNSKLTFAEIASLRFYTSHSYDCINAPLRDQHRVASYPLPAMISCIQSGLKKLRALDADTALSLHSVVLWRGFYNMKAPSDFFVNGGTELAPMSTTPDLSVAVRYAINKPEKEAKPCLLLRIVTRNNLQRGASVKWLSMFPGEEEILFPPLTYLQATGRVRLLQHGLEDTTAGTTDDRTPGKRGFDVTIVEVMPSVP
jgi:hypothetical protein